MTLCKYFLNGNCRYGQRCRFVHAYNQPRDYYGYDDSGYKPRQNNPKTYSGVSILRNQQPSAASFRSSPVNNTSSNFNVASQYSSNTNSSNFCSSNLNYYNQINNQPTNVSNPNESELLSVILKEIETIENNKQWPLTCLCPHKDVGNIPGWIDYSPEELRCEVYRSYKEGKFEQCKLYFEQLAKVAEEKRNEFKSRETGLKKVEDIIHQKRTSPSSTISGHFDHNSSSDGIAFFKGGSNVTSILQPQTALPGFGLQPAFSAPQSNVFNDPAPGFSFQIQNSSGTVNSPAPFGQQFINTNQITQTLSNPTQAVQPFSNSFDNLSNQTVNSNFVSPPTVTNKHEDVIYSNKSQLTEIELCSFQAKTFKFGHIPLNPPPKELC